jgi:RNase H-fold protein (predicted Holliday junction resolvase)
MQNYLAIDYGSKKIGLAIAIEGVALPLSIIPTKKIFSTLP